MVRQLRTIPDTVDDFTGYRIGLDLFAWDAPGLDDVQDLSPERHGDRAQRRRCRPSTPTSSCPTRRSSPESAADARRGSTPSSRTTSRARRRCRTGDASNVHVGGRRLVQHQEALVPRGAALTARAAPGVEPLGRSQPARPSARADRPCTRFLRASRLLGRAKQAIIIGCPGAWRGMACPRSPCARPPVPESTTTDYRPMSGPLAGKVALVTGAARGIGRAIARKLARGGLRRRRQLLQQRRRSRGAVRGDSRARAGARTRSRAASACPTASTRCSPSSRKHFDRLDIVVSNAASAAC